MKDRNMISLDLPKKLAHEARIMAAKKNISRSEFIRQAIALMINAEKTGVANDKKIDELMKVYNDNN